MADPTAPHVAKTTKRKPDTCSVCGHPAVVSEVHHPRAATLHLGGAAWAHPDLAPLVHDLYVPGGGDTLAIARHPENPRRGDHAAIVKSVLANGVYTPPKVQQSTTYVLAGNHSFDAMVDAGAVRMPWVWLDVDDREARRIMADDNRTAELGGYDQAMLLENLRALDAAGDLLLTAWTPDDLEDQARMLANLEFVTGLTLDGEPVTTASSPIDTDGESERVTVTVDKGHRQDLYALLADQSWVRDVADAHTRKPA